VADSLGLNEPLTRQFSGAVAVISPFRRRMIEDMTVRNLSPATQ